MAGGDTFQEPKARLPSLTTSGEAARLRKLIGRGFTKESPGTGAEIFVSN
jgi:hypothetical protein